MKHEIRKLLSNTLFKETLNFYTKPNIFTYPSLLKACGKLKATPKQSHQIHARIVTTGFHTNVYTATALITFYMKLHLLNDALKVFDQMPDPNLVSTNSMISGLSRNAYCREALMVFRNVGFCGFRWNSVTVASGLSSCERLEDGVQIQGLGVKLGVESDVYVGTAALSMYLKCGELVEAVRVFGLMEVKNVVSYNALMFGIARGKLCYMVFDLFKEMREVLDEEPTSGTWVSVLSACSECSDLRFGKQVHNLIVKYEVSCDVMVGTSLVDMYAKCRCLKSAYEIFNELGCCRNLVTWNTMISGMMLNNHSETAIELFEQLNLEGLVPDSTSWNSMISGFSQLGKGDEAFMFFKRMQLAREYPSLKSVTSLLPACSDLSAIQSGKVIHGHTIRTAIVSDEFISTALIDMYMKCGCSTLARQIFDQFERRPNDPAFWNAMISGYGRNGEDESALEVFELMGVEGVQPNSATFIGILSACSHTGKVDKGAGLFRMMSRHYGVTPISEHFGCVVDLLGRAGRLYEAWGLIQYISEPSSSAYASLLGACRCHLDDKLGEEIAERLLELEPDDPSPYVILSNIYAGQGKWRDIERVREMMKDMGVRKIPGSSLIGVARKTTACT
ncbi:hypothetical protein GIB67_033048 [Kingdonia uniflora]|uniref:Pentatricopeptide repeat-containing protein n=1 Tax=Kingdonia uniflora TaxID=39325 RepID=A0A7J7MYT5_9MAGN|nr:hypothetical protein GIB67_033048 [Kingdonia uniflora]